MNLPVFWEGNTMDSETKQPMTGRCWNGEKGGIWGDIALFFSAFVYVWKPSIIKKFPKIKLTLTIPWTKCCPQCLLEGPGSQLCCMHCPAPTSNSWLECTVTVSAEPACPLGSRVSAMMQLPLACWELERETLSGKARASHKENVSQHSRTPHPLTLITKSLAWQPVGAEVGAECWDRCWRPCRKQPSLSDTKSSNFFHLHNKMGL